MGFERNYQVKILSNQINKILYSIAIPQSQIRYPDLKPNFVTDFIDGEGSFIIRIQINPKFKIEWNVEAKFSICLDQKDIEVLKLL